MSYWFWCRQQRERNHFSLVEHLISAQQNGPKLVEKKPKSILSQPQIRRARTTKSGRVFSWESFEKIYLLEMSERHVFVGLFCPLKCVYWVIDCGCLSPAFCSGIHQQLTWDEHWGMPFPHLKIEINNPTNFLCEGICCKKRLIAA
jgi:hypothetical protein